eukprot:Phypoly_transcript_09170.p1 GENE.Phypoly_transcript_09170~~Phypoly_transcript_09170.p1  ORF type:complete len:427 (+),score=70.65 Phypoly_transcript_09170:135-1415(+)
MEAHGAVVKLAASAVVGGVVGALGVLAYNKLQSPKQENTVVHSVLAAPPTPNEEIYLEQMNRTILFYGEDKFPEIRKAFVVVVGVGGVGSSAAHVLLRSGIGKMRLIDPDLVTLSSLNRSSVAQRKDVGRTKVQVLADYFQRICPETQVESFETFFTEELAPTLLAGKPDFVLDCIDNRDAKVGLMAYCKNNNIKIISSFGAGSAHDPTKINVCDLKDSFGCVFGKTIRRYLRPRGIHSGILVVCSTELEKKKQIKLTEEELKIAMESDVKRGVRLSKIGVAMPIPSIFGTVMANCVLSALVGLPVIYAQETRVAGPQMSAQRIYKLLVKHELDFHHKSPIETKNLVNVNDITHLTDTYDNKSVLSGASKGIGRVVRWRASKPPTLDNLVYMTAEEFDAHIKIPSVEEHYPKDVVERVDKLLAESE